MLKLWLAGLLVVLCAACQTPKSDTESSGPLVIESTVPEDQRLVADLVAYAQRHAQMNAEEQKRELSSVQAAYNRERGTYARVKLALVLSMPGAPGQDDVRALQLLEPYGVDNQTGTLRQFANLLHEQLSERMRQARRADQLKEQLDALRAIERSFIDRGVPPQPRKP